MTLVGHSKAVMSAHFSPGSIQIVSASEDCTIRIWDASVQTQKSSKSVVQTIHLLAISADGAYIAAVKSNHTVELWDAITGKLSQTLKGHSGRVNTVTFSPTGSKLVSGSADKSIRLWDTATGRCCQIINGHLDNVETVKFLASGHQIVSGSFDQTVQIWNTENGMQYHAFTDHTGCVHDVTASSDGVYVISASEDTTVCVWDVKNKALQHILHGHSKGVHTVSISPNDQVIASASWHEQAIQLWDIATGAKLSVLKNTEIHHKLHFSPDQRFLLGGLSCVSTGLEPYIGDTRNVLDFQQFPDYYMKDGWVTSLASQLRVCWIPQAYRDKLIYTSRGAAMATPAGMMIILDFTKLKLYMNHAN